MALADDLKTEAHKIFSTQWTSRDGQVAPEPEAVGLGNDSVGFDRATVLYADLTGSTRLVDGESWQFSAEIYKTYLYCAAKLIREEGGKITSYDGDRIMGVFIGKSQTTSAVRCALKINWAVINVINPALKQQYTASDYTVKQVIGTDTSPIHAARTGVRGGNDLVWVGRAANHAAKLTAIKNDGPTWITADAYNQLASPLGGSEKSAMFKPFTWNTMNKAQIYSSSWWYRIE